MKKFLYTLFCILIITIITSVYLPQKASASNPEIQKVVLIKAVKDINNKWEWMFQLTTQNADGYYIRIDINKIQNGQSTKIKTVDVGQPIVLNQITVLTGSILDDKTTYIVYFTVFNGENNIPYPNSMKFYSDTTGKAVSQPIITSFTPTEGKDGDSVTIIGSGFTGARKVFINDTEMTNLSVENDNKIVATIAEGTKSGKILVNFYMNSVISQNSFNIKTDPVDVTGENDPSVVNKDIYTPLAPIGNLNQVKTTDVGTYLNIIFKIAIGLCAVLAVIMIVIGGVSYMGNESVFGKTEAKSRITAAILGLIIALGAYALLNTIDPNLLGKNGVKIDQVTAEMDAIEYINPESFNKITGKKILTPSQYDTIGRKVAKEVGIPFCAIRVILERESKGNPGAIGFDENVRNSGIPSRVAFINSGKKYTGESFTPTSDLIGKQGFVNQSKNDIKNTPGLGLDWRFSKGIGLTQITLFPSGYFENRYKTNPPGLNTKDTYPTLNGLTPKDLLDPEKNLTAGAQIWKKSWVACGKDIYGSWVGYGGGPGKCTTDNDFLKKEATTRTEFYNGCPETDKQL